MIPIQLTIEGLYSYQERQTINFTDLTEAGLFGIFGTVGSGKSSILEAITFALYGNSDRLGGTNFAYNMMNLKSTRLYIEFEFYNHEQNKFKIVREYKRNSKQFDKVINSTVILYEYINGDWSPKESSNVEPIIGLSSSNFRRTIIIPQGQFKEFIELGATERTKMMKDIFGLQRYDLQERTSILASKTKSDLDQLQGKLSGYENISEESILILRDELVDLIHNESQSKAIFDLVNENFQRLKLLKLDVESLKIKKSEFEILNQDKLENDKKEQQLNQYELVYNVFHNILIDQEKLQLEINQNRISLNEQSITLQHSQDELKKLVQSISNIQPKYDDLKNRRTKESDFAIITQILQFSQEIKELEANTKKGLDYVNTVSSASQLISSSITILENEISTLSKDRIDPSILMSIDNWFSTLANITQSQNEINKKIESLETKKVELNSQIKLHESDLDSFEEKYKLIIEDIDKSKIELNKLKNEFTVQQKVAEYSNELHDGQPCPLCGSHDHPNIAVLDDVSSKIEQINLQLEAKENEKNTTNNILQSLRNIKQQIDFYDQQLLHENNSLASILVKLDNHQNLFIWEGFAKKNKNDFDLKKQKAVELENLLATKNEELKNFRSQLDQQRNTLEKANAKLEKYRLEEIQKATQITQNKLQLKQLNYTEFENLSSAEILTQLNQLKIENDKIESDYQKLTDSYNKLMPKIASQKTTIELISKNIQKLESSLIDINNRIDQALLDNHYKSILEVKDILLLQLDTSSIRKHLEDFRVKYEVLHNSILVLEEKLNNVSYDESLYTAEEQKLQQAQSEFKEASENVTKVKTEIERLEKEFSTKKELLQQLSITEKRADNLKTLSNLFKGAGFVQYVSSIYLRQLCDHANIRFHRMTRNQLSLQLNDNNDFEIIDYLNEGRSRSVKTLSGGQAFQVSLSLALALAESVQSNAKADKNFFFIDEGFGTQDMDSINIVFETLQSLLKENRIVGIISHVEELKERIPLSLQITKDEEKGSIISYN